jgi:hypothetical protein
MGGAAHIRAVIVASLAGTLFGFDTAVIAGITQALSRSIFTLLVLSRSAGLECTVAHTTRSTLVAGCPGDSRGSRDMPRVVGLPYVISALVSAFARKLFIYAGNAGIALERMSDLLRAPRRVPARHNM